ncbi:DUF1329 domain-containing protein [Pseudomonas sp. RGM2987]|uniref:DUF1329 domain-containing protein n=1 Tax=Pseudomonas sp. RGM2987 TaxID=2930090 RepID=UPI001FD63319|nr:DUF1329 domain-containing protein [Pseudomonas sp. RGM2987]MCJ8206421.1 DUF1329 domain-containing protein [Pseudomonas sp. RGM2987]
MLMSTLFCPLAFSAVTAEKASELGAALTPVGAEKSGDAGLGIPQWQGGLSTNAGAVDDKGFLADPFSNEKPLLVITAATAAQYKDHITPGQLALFKRYPETYKMPVYPTHRTANFPAEWLEMTRANATKVKLVEGGNGLENYAGGVPFPIPETGQEVIWNHLTAYRGHGFSRFVVQATPQQNGGFVPVQFEDQVLPFYGMSKPNGELQYYKQVVTAPARLAGNVLLVHDYLNQVDNPRQAWIYNAGQRRVRRAPQVAYDGPGTASDGLRTADNLDMFNGALDRYDWKLEGKKSLFIATNSYRLDSPKLKYEDIIRPGHINQDLARYELHRVWHVTATLKPGARHIYAKRDLYIDEDSWLIATVDHYDGRDALWRVAEGHAQFYYHQQLPSYTLDALYDLASGRYLVMGMKNEEKHAWNFDIKQKESDYTTAGLRQSGVR